jgi:hypothetical protein
MTEDDALTAALLWLKDVPQDDRLYDVSFGRYAKEAGTAGCWWSMRLVTEVRNGEVQPSPEDDEKKILQVIRAWREAYQSADLSLLKTS